MKAQQIGVIAVIFAVCSASMPVTIGQISYGSADLSQVDKYEKALKSKEPSFKRGHKSTEKRENSKYTTVEWTKGDDFVSVRNTEFASVEEAASAMTSALNVPKSQPRPRTKLTNLGDEAYISVGYENYTQMIIRKDNVLILLSATSPKLAKRFARHLVDSIDSK